MTWVKLDDGMIEHPKILGISDKSLRLFLVGLSYCSRQLTDGFVPSAIGVSLGRKYATELVNAGIWETTPGGYIVHDYLDYQPSKAEVIELRAKRSEAGRKGGKRSKPPSKREANASTGASDMSEAKRNPGPSPTPTPRTRETSSDVSPVAAPRRNAHWDALVTVFGYSPKSRDEQTLWGKLAKSLAEMDASEETLTEAARRYRLSMPNVELTPPSLVKHYERLLAQPVKANGHVSEISAQAQRLLGGAG